MPGKDECYDVAFRQMVRNDQFARLTKAVAQHVLLAGEADTPGKGLDFADCHGHTLSVASTRVKFNLQFDVNSADMGRARRHDRGIDAKGRRDRKAFRRIFLALPPASERKRTVL